MSLSKMVARCKKSKHVFIYQLGDLKYLSDGYILYRLKDFSSVCLENIFEYMDVDDDKKNDYHVAVREIDFETYIEDIPRQEKLKRYQKTIGIPDQAVGFSSERGMILVDDKLLDVFRPLPDYTQYYLSIESPPTILLASGNEVIGGVLPLAYDYEKLHTELRSMAEGAEKSYRNGFNCTGHQVTMGDLMKEAAANE